MSEGLSNLRHDKITQHVSDLDNLNSYCIS